MSFIVTAKKAAKNFVSEKIKQNERLCAFFLPLMVKEAKKQFLVTHTATLPNFPLHLNIESSNICNLNCVMCPHGEMTRRANNMKPDTFKRIIDESALYGLDSAWLHVLGEPLLNPHIFDFIKYAKQYDNLQNVGFSTNCSFLDEKKAKLLLESKIDQIILSLDGMTREVYESIRQKGDYEVVKSNIERFLTMRKEMGRDDITVWLSIIDMEPTHSQVDRYWEYWRPFLMSKSELLVKPFTNFGGQIDEELRYNGDGSSNHRNVRVPCWNLWNNLTILWNGDVVICCYDGDGEMIVGNIHQKSIEEIWKGELQNYYRRLHRKEEWDELPLCKTCDFNTLEI